MKSDKEIHERAIFCAKNYHKAESKLLEILQQVDEQKVFRRLGFSSLFQYATSALKLSEGQAYGLIGVARKAKEVPQLKEAIQAGTLNVSKARRVVSVITPENKEKWIEKAATLSQREVEKEVAKQNPERVVAERIKPVSDRRCEFKCGVSEPLERKIRRVQDLLSQKTKRPATLEQALEAMADLYLEKQDPVQKAKRRLGKEKTSSELSSRTEDQRTPVPARIKHQVHARDLGRCTFRNNQNQRCENTRWIELHHRKGVAQGGDHSAANLVSVCSVHHKAYHEREARWQ